MTEQEWLEWEGPTRIITALIDQRLITERKQRLFGCAVVRQQWHLLEDARSKQAVLVAEKLADGLATPAEVAQAQNEVDETDHLMYNAPAKNAAHDAYFLLMSSSIAAREPTGGEYRVDPVTQIRLLRDIVGNPFKPLPEVRPEQLTPTVLALAQAAYRSGTEDGLLDVDTLGILADALEDAGCTAERCGKCHGSGTYTVEARNPGLSTANGYGPATTYTEWRGCWTCGGNYDRKGTGTVAHSIITHLRTPGPHVKGCWVLDVLLRK